MTRFLLVLLAFGFAAAVQGKSAFDTLIYTHDAHEVRYKVGNCKACHGSILKSNKAKDDNYASQQTCHRIGCHDIKNNDSCHVCHTNANAKSPIKPKREIKFSHKIHAILAVQNAPEQENTGLGGNGTRRINQPLPKTPQGRLMWIYELMEQGDTVTAKDVFRVYGEQLRKSLDPEIFRTLKFTIDNKGPAPIKVVSAGKSAAPPGRPSAGIDCKVCHGYIEKMSYFTRNDMPPMGQCLECHKNEKMNGNCDFCHTDRTIIRSHGPDRASKHGDLYYKSPQSCETCHENNHCDKCHKGQTTVDVHPRNYLHLHQFDVFSGSMECETCHDPRQSCDGCHMKTWGRIVDHRSAIMGTQSCKSCHRGK